MHQSFVFLQGALATQVSWWTQVEQCFTLLPMASRALDWITFCFAPARPLESTRPNIAQAVMIGCPASQDLSFARQAPWTARLHWASLSQLQGLAQWAPLPRSTQASLTLQ